MYLEPLYEYLNIQNIFKTTFSHIYYLPFHLPQATGKRKVIVEYLQFHPHFLCWDSLGTGKDLIKLPPRNRNTLSQREISFG